jgi:hypothetical protein
LETKKDKEKSINQLDKYKNSELSGEHVVNENDIGMTKRFHLIAVIYNIEFTV